MTSPTLTDDLRELLALGRAGHDTAPAIAVALVIDLLLDTDSARSTLARMDLERFLVYGQPCDRTR